MSSQTYANARAGNGKGWTININHHHYPPDERAAAAANISAFLAQEVVERHCTLSLWNSAPSRAESEAHGCVVDCKKDSRLLNHL